MLCVWQPHSQNNSFPSLICWCDSLACCIRVLLLHCGYIEITSRFSETCIICCSRLNTSGTFICFTCWLQVYCDVDVMSSDQLWVRTCVWKSWNQPLLLHLFISSSMCVYRQLDIVNGEIKLVTNWDIKEVYFSNEMQRTWSYSPQGGAAFIRKLNARALQFSF